MSDSNDKNTYSSWLMYYLGSKNEGEFDSTTVNLGCHMLTNKMNRITATAMWQESNILKSHKELY